MAKKKSQATRHAEAAAATERAAAIRAEHARAERRRRALVVGVVVVGIFALVLGIGYAVQSGRDTTGEEATAPSGVVDEYAVPRGEASAPVTVTVFEDFQCPHCAAFEAAAGPMLEKHVENGDVQVRYHPMAFLGDYSTRATSAYAAVLDTTGPQAAAEFHDLLFTNQPPEGSAGLSDEQLVELAVQAGADRGEVAGPIEDLAFEQWVVNATDAANKDGVRQTPTVRVNGETVEYTTVEELATVLDQAIQQG